MADVNLQRDLRRIAYSRQGTIAAITRYYKFLIDMYMDSDVVEYPPETGWPEITPATMQAIGKTDEVIELLRHLPYIRHGDHEIQCMCRSSRLRSSLYSLR